VVILQSTFNTAKVRLLSRSRRLLDQGCNLFWMREKNGMASVKLDRLRLGSVTHEPFQLDPAAAVDERAMNQDDILDRT
jgi:hypothetical protein